jgi:hypothetical protein
MSTFSKLLIVVATATATLGATNSAFAWYSESYQPSYVEQSDESYFAYDKSIDDGYPRSHGMDYHGFGRGREQIAGHDRRR